ncbi:MAG: hypothetical protein HOE14_09375 [Gemmatimonadales bacterium]|nr:hypothetical protein [Gemmatimonadales bacterium]
MSPAKTTASAKVTYSGGLDGVIVHLPSGATEFLRGVAVEVPAGDATVLASHPDFAPAATTPTIPKPSKEVS